MQGRLLGIKGGVKAEKTIFLFLSSFYLEQFAGRPLDKAKTTFDFYFLSFFSEGCEGRPLGMEDGRIPDEDISASSYFDYHSVGPHNARSF
jgi:hypothetical protein